MKNRINIAIGFIAFFTLFISGTAQTLPPIQVFSPEDYNADNQNWQISQSEEGFIYVANNRGLLEFDGSNWHVYTSPNNTILRSVKVIDDRIYTGCYMDFGYWIRNSYGILEYFSLASKLEEKMKDDDQIWSILEFNEWVIFQSPTTIYFYNTETGKFRLIPSKTGIYRAFNTDNSIYYDVRYEGIYRMENGSPKLIIDDPKIKNKRVVNIFEDDDQLIVLTVESGFYKVEGSNVVRWDIPANKKIENDNIFCGLKLTDGSFIVGTISSGIIHITANGEIDYQIDQTNGLSNNTALSLFEDRDNNVWVGLDNGINCINITSPIQVFNDFEGHLGTVYNSLVFKGILYAGTNQGLFYKEAGSKDPLKFIENTHGQVWDLYNFNNEVLLCGHHLGTYIIEKDKATLIDNTLGTWAFKEIPSHKELLLKGNYNGLYVLDNTEGRWKVRNKIEGFNSSSRFFELDNDNHIWVSHEYKGVYKLTLNDSLTKVLKIEEEPFSTVGKNSSLAKYNGAILYGYENGIYKYDKKGNFFGYDSILSPIIKNDDYISGKLVVDSSGRLWGFSTENIYYVTVDHLTNNSQIHAISIPLKLRKVTQSFENISLIKDEVYLLGTANGYLTIDLSKIDNEKPFKIYLNSVNITDIDNNTSALDLQEQGEFKFKAGIITFNYSVPSYEKYLDIDYQYKLDGQNSKWSDWSTSATTRFENLGFGDYTFSVRAKVGNKLTENTVNYTFTVNRPWYLSNMALLVYFIFLALIAYFVHKGYKQYYHRAMKRKQLENERLIIRMRNEQLNKDIESKNRELAISKMNILRKNELLNEIKKELENNEDSDSVGKLIDKNLNNKKDWEIFVKAFKDTDKEFLDKLKRLHPDLTPNDLRFCVYLRLNLSSKEIAPLLNISVKSVETRRYRLRKRMNLPHEESLVNYILNL